MPLGFWPLIRKKDLPAKPRTTTRWQVLCSVEMDAEDLDVGSIVKFLKTKGARAQVEMINPVAVPVEEPLLTVGSGARPRRAEENS